MERELRIDLLRRMLRIRAFESRLKDFYDYAGYFAVESAEEEAQSAAELLTCVSYEFSSRGMIGGAVHLSIGQEAVSVGVCANLGPGDAAFSSHRSHGHFLAKGGSMDAALAELMGRATGCSRGCGGSMHLFDPDIAFLGGNGIIGAQLTLALGPAFAAKYRGTRDVSVAFFGDGGANQGTFNEALNLATLWKLPVLFVCENNLYANSTPAAIALSEPDVAARAAGYGLPGVVADGQDVLAMYAAAKDAVDRARDGGGPTLLEAKTYRFEGHCGVAHGHQHPDECAAWKQRDPLVVHGERLAAEGLLSAAERGALEAEVHAELDAAVAFAISSPWPERVPGAGVSYAEERAR
ncbi:MAG: thiamine pyrophosphate-dependent dehydrogenase E1 component subunit alpha [Armatimonadetes bacterium]|nr:thiamine pyrophosphate-dependent dehydrogenase E1 component subunit alpha [Armatimonadota bacterium]